MDLVLIDHAQPIAGTAHDLGAEVLIAHTQGTRGAVHRRYHRDKMWRGAKPSELRVERGNRFQLVINLNASMCRPP